MAESLVNVTEGSGKKLHSFNRTIGANSVEDEVMLQGLPYLATYTFEISNVSLATANSHLLEIDAGASLSVWIVEIELYQMAAATTGAFCEFDLRRTTTAGTAGTARTARAHDPGDAAAGATAIQLPTIGVIGNGVGHHWGAYITQTPGAGGMNENPLIKYNALRTPFAKAPRIAAGVNNGIALRCVTGVAGATASGYITVVESNYT